MNILKIIILSLSLLSASYAQDANTTNRNHYIDEWHKETTQRFKSVSEYIDAKLFDLAEYIDEDNNATIREAVQKENKKSKIPKRKRHADEFFLSDKFISETDHPYMRVTPESIFNSKESNDYRLKISAHLPLSRSKKRFKLFIGNLSDDNYNDILSDDKKVTKPEVGINYFLPETYGINAKYSLGIHGLYPFARARFSTDFNPYNWDVEMVQTFQYSSDDDFEEKTQFYFDTSFYNLSLFRLQFERGTEDNNDGMSYSGAVIMFWQPSYKTGLTFAQLFMGRTDYVYTPNKNTVPAFTKEMDGIHDYKTTLTYRQNIYRKWLFYEIEPGVNFSAIHDFEPNYSLRLKLDIFYGGL